MNQTEAYASYLNSPYWRQVSDLVKAQAGHRCQLCNTPHNLQAHHRTYEHRGQELDHLGDLTCLCWTCHSIFHGVMPAPATASPMPMVKITDENRRRLRYNKETWRWMKEAGIEPRKRLGQARRGPDGSSPLHFMSRAFRTEPQW